ncbi:MAG: hypothetical protein ABIQ95_09400 [Bdellovibrionia bacterium]
MKGHSHSPCVMTDTEQFYVRICGCGVVHLCFGATLINLAPEAIIAVTETLKEVSNKLRFQMMGDPVDADASPVDIDRTVIRGYFPPKSL